MREKRILTLLQLCLNCSNLHFCIRSRQLTYPSRIELHNLRCVRMSYCSTKLLFDVTFNTEDCMLCFKISFYLLRKGKI